MGISGLNTGYGGLQRSLNNMRQDAVRVADGSSDTDDLATPLLNVTRDRTEALASVKVIHAADSMIGSLIDEKV